MSMIETSRRSMAEFADDTETEPSVAADDAENDPKKLKKSKTSLSMNMVTSARKMVRRTFLKMENKKVKAFLPAGDWFCKRFGIDTCEVDPSVSNLLGAAVDQDDDHGAYVNQENNKFEIDFLKIFAQNHQNRINFIYFFKI